VDHAVGTGHVHTQVLDARKVDLNPELLLDVAHPGNVRVVAVDRQAEQLAVERLELGLVPGEGRELCGAHRREVGRVGEQHQPFALVVGQLLHAVGGPGLEVGGRGIELGEGGGSVDFGHGSFLSSG